MEPAAAQLEAFAAAAARDSDRVVVLGMGGSSLAPLVFASCSPPAFGRPTIEVLDSTEPSTVHAVAERADPARTLFVVSSKSGTTLEPNILFDFFFERAQRALGAAAGGRFVIVTDPGSALEEEGARRRVRATFAGDPRIGGRYSALSNFGMVPAALLGMDVRQLLRRARAMAESCRSEPRRNPGALLGAAMGALALAGRDKLTFSTGAPLGRFGMWAEQLIAESTGKEGKGILPVEGEPLGAPAVYGSDRFFIGIATDGEGPIASGAAELDALVRDGHPAARWAVGGPLDLGSEMFRWEFATAVAGALLGINPFDQPNVQEAKDRTNAILDGEGITPGGAASGAGDLRSHLASLAPGDYFAINAYLPSTAENERALARTRLRVRDAKRVATTVGFGPRFLHSTGQLHKGGPDTGVFLQITAAPAVSLPVPGKPYGFGEVIAAQAAGDFAALEARGRRVAAARITGEVAAGLSAIDAAVGASLAGS